MYFLILSIVLGYMFGYFHGKALFFVLFFFSWDLPLRGREWTPGFYFTMKNFQVDGKFSLVYGLSNPFSIEGRENQTVFHGKWV